MLMSKLFPGTLRDVEKGLSRSYHLLLQGGFISAQAAGIWHLLPLGFRVHRKICTLIYDTMEKYGVLNVSFPILQPKEDWVQSGRWDAYVKTRTMFVTEEQHSKALYGLAPTAEEMVTTLVAQRARSYKELPIILHQIGPKFRDELRPRNGLLRTREFSMSDAYSFDADEEGMRQSFELMRKIYQEIFDRLELRYIAVQADSGAIGGKGSSEFMALSSAGEDTLLTCNQCNYGANQERCTCIVPEGFSQDTSKEVPLAKTLTPGIHSVKGLEDYCKMDARQMVKTVIWSTDQKPAVVCIRGDLEINKVKLQNALGVTTLEEASPQVVEQVTGAPVGFAGPLHLKMDTFLLFDESVRGMGNFLCGANEKDYHYLHVSFGRDLPEPASYHDLVLAQKGFTCKECQTGTLTTQVGIEIGHIFQLQDKYSKTLKANYQASDGKQQVLQMGCYGIGTSRLIQTLAEQHHDERGLIWPSAVAPYQVIVIPINVTDNEHRTLAEKFYHTLKDASVDVLLDDRDARAGVKFADAELLGWPWRITCGRTSKEGKAELTCRKTGKSEVLSFEEIVAKLRETLNGVR